MEDAGSLAWFPPRREPGYRKPSKVLHACFSFWYGPEQLPLPLCGLAESDRAFSLTTTQYRSWIAITWLPSRYVLEALPMHLTL